MLRLSVVTGSVFAVAVAAAFAQQPPPAPPAGQQPVPELTPAEVEQIRRGMAGSWQFDNDESKDDERNWRRPVSPTPTAPINTPGGGGASMPTPGGGQVGTGRWPDPNESQAGRRTTSTLFVNDAARALRDLLEVAEKYAIQIGPEAVTFTDDLGRVFKFSLTAEKEKHRIGATEFFATTRWDGMYLVQEITALGQLKISQIFLPSSDQKSLFLWIKVEKPLFTPRIKDITRVYTRVSS